MVSYSPKKRAGLYQWAVGAAPCLSSQHSQGCMGIPWKMKWKCPRYRSLPCYSEWVYVFSFLVQMTVSFPH